MFRGMIELLAYLPFYLHIELMGIQIHYLHQIMSKQAHPGLVCTSPPVEMGTHALAVE
jgi:hypothetical protein